MTKATTRVSTDSNTFNRLWKRSTVDGDGLGMPHYHRWTLAKFPRKVRMYLHRYLNSDWTRDPHDHPKPFLSIGLWGSYWEEEYTPVYADGEVHHFIKTLRRYTAPWIRWFPAHYVHRIRLIPGRRRAITLCITGPESRDWGFWKGAKWYRWDVYLREFANDRIAQQ